MRSHAAVYPERAPKKGRRPGRPVDYGKRWRARAAAARARDSYACRICGHAIGVKGGHVDHIVPRRLLGRSRAEIEDPTNLALLCQEHHAHKTQTIEPLLYGGRNLQPFHRYLETLARTGPVPSAELIGRALERAAAALRRPKP